METLLNVKEIQCNEVELPNGVVIYQLLVTHIDTNNDLKKEAIRIDSGVILQMKVINGAPALVFGAGREDQISNIGFSYEGFSENISLGVIPNGIFWRLECIGGIDVRDGRSRDEYSMEVGMMTRVYLKAIFNEEEFIWELKIIKEEMA